MKNITFFCLTLNPENEKLIRKLSYVPVGLGDKNFSKNCFTDKNKKNISNKNPFYGEYTFHYWLWKNYLKEIKTPWVGFCQYRKFFARENFLNFNDSFKKLQESVFTEINEKEVNFDCILGEKFSVENYKISKILKHHLLYFLKNPQAIINKKKRNLKFHFDLFHGKGNLDKAILKLDDSNKDDFSDYMKNNTSFNPHNMFICKTEILEKYYEIIFPWLEKCESDFGFNQNNSYGLKRIYGFLAERFLSYWFAKNFKIKELPIVFKDLSDYKNL
jgi:hypothetical protein